MRIERLSLKGLTKFRDVVTLDFRELPPGLVAITGENGAGKTTILEAMFAAVHRSFASRDGELYDYATGRDSFIEEEIAIDGCGVFRSRVNIDGPKRNSDAVLTAIRPDGTFPLNDGRVSDFDRAVALHFPSKDLLLASAFAAQNKTGSFITLDKKARKALFMRLLAIERYQTMSDTARQAASLVDQGRGRLMAVRDELARGTTSDLVDELDRLANRLQVEGGDAETQRIEIKAVIAGLEERLALVQDQVAAHAAATQRVRTLEADVAARRAELARLRQERTQALKDSGTELARLVAQRTAKIAEIEGLIANNQKLIANGDAVRAAAVAVDAAHVALTDLRSPELTAHKTLEVAEQAVRTREKELTAFAQTRRDLARAEEDAETLKTVPFGSNCAAAECRFLVGANRAAEQIVPLRTTLAAEADAYQDLTRLKAEVDEHKTLVASLRAAIGTHEATITAQSKMAGLRDKVAAADARIDELQKQRTETFTIFEQLGAANGERERAALARIDDRVGIVDSEAAALGLALDTARADLETSAEGNRQAVVLQGQLAEARGRWDATTAILARVEAGHADLARRRAEMTAKLRRLANVDTTVKTMGDELLDWQFLTKGLGRDGLPVLEIDAAGPTISAYTNELLTACFGARFSVELVTQREKADGKGHVDDFSIQVFDNAAGGDPRDIADLSGGEQVIVAEALMNAISIYVNTTAPIPVRTCWRDETTGALDPENAQRYLAMLRKVQELGGFHHVFFISHNADAAGQADAQIRVTNGTAAIVLPPFAAAAEAA